VKFMADIYDSYFSKLTKKIEEPNKPPKKRFDEPLLNDIMEFLEDHNEEWIQTTDVFNEVREKHYFNSTEQAKLLRVLIRIHVLGDERLDGYSVPFIYKGINKEPGLPLILSSWDDVIFYCDECFEGIRYPPKEEKSKWDKITKKWRCNNLKLDLKGSNYNHHLRCNEELKIYIK